MISLEQLVPKDHLARKVSKTIDFELIRQEVAHLYCPAWEQNIKKIALVVWAFMFGLWLKTV